LLRLVLTFGCITVITFLRRWTFVTLHYGWLRYHDVVVCTFRGYVWLRSVWLLVVPVGYRLVARAVVAIRSPFTHTTLFYRLFPVVWFERSVLRYRLPDVYYTRVAHVAHWCAPHTPFTPHTRRPTTHVYLLYGCPLPRCWLHTALPHVGIVVVLRWFTTRPTGYQYFRLAFPTQWIVIYLVYLVCYVHLYVWPFIFYGCWFTWPGSVVLPTTPPLRLYPLLRCPSLLPDPVFWLLWFGWWLLPHYLPHLPPPHPTPLLHVYLQLLPDALLRSRCCAFIYTHLVYVYLCSLRWFTHLHFAFTPPPHTVPLLPHPFTTTYVALTFTHFTAPPAHTVTTVVPVGSGCARFGSRYIYFPHPPRSVVAFIYGCTYVPGSCRLVWFCLRLFYYPHLTRFGLVVTVYAHMPFPFTLPLVHLTSSPAIAFTPHPIPFTF